MLKRKLVSLVLLVGLVSMTVPSQPVSQPAMAAMTSPSSVQDVVQTAWGWLFGMDRDETLYLAIITAGECAMFGLWIAAVGCAVDGAL